MKKVRKILALLSLGITLYLIIIFFPYIVLSMVGLAVIGLVTATALYFYIRYMLKKAQQEFTQAMETSVKKEFKQRTDAFFGAEDPHSEEQTLVIHVEAETIQSD